METETPHIKLKRRLYFLEAGEELSWDPNDYLYIREGTDLSKILLHFDQVDPLVCEKYQVSASYEEERVEFSIRVWDRTPPEIILKEDIPVYYPYQIIKCSDLAEASDVSDATIEIDFDETYPYPPREPGEYELTLVATDSYKNETRMKVTIPIEPLVLSLDPAVAEKIRTDDALPQSFKDFFFGSDNAVIGENLDFNDMWAFGFDDPLLPGQTFSLQDMCDMIDNGGSTYHMIGVKYGVLDCGMDGKPDLALLFTFQEGPRDIVDMTTVLHEEDGILTMNFAGQAWHRSWTELYQDGFYEDGGAGGAGTHHYRYGVLNASGSLIKIYDCTADIGFGGFENIKGMSQARLDYFGYEKWDEHTSKDWDKLMDITGNMEVDTFTIQGQTYLSCYFDPEADPKELEELKYLLSLCEKNGGVLYSNEEIERIITKRMDTLGVSAWNRERTEEDLVVWNPLLSSPLSEIYIHRDDLRMHYYSDN
ncbi:MAG: hypothetical protein J1E61_04810 [Lachnospiraceae bacterium]|nr:hypothetical protein [Lachnospiraceae bacterium]